MGMVFGGSKITVVQVKAGPTLVGTPDRECRVRPPEVYQRRGVMNESRRNEYAVGRLCVCSGTKWWLTVLLRVDR